MKNVRKKARDFESYVRRIVKKELSRIFKFRKNIVLYSIEKPKLKKGHRPDLVICSFTRPKLKSILAQSGAVIVIDAKTKRNLTRHDIDKIVRDCEECNAMYGIIYAARRTNVSEDVLEYVRENGIRIRRVMRPPH